MCQEDFKNEARRQRAGNQAIQFAFGHHMCLHNNSWSYVPFSYTSEWYPSIDTKEWKIDVPTMERRAIAQNSVRIRPKPKVAITTNRSQ